MKYRRIPYPMIPNSVNTTSLFVHKDTRTLSYHHLYTDLRGHGLWLLKVWHQTPALPLTSCKPFSKLLTHWNNSTSWSVKLYHSSNHQIQLLWEVNEIVRGKVCSVAPCMYSITFSIFFLNNSSLSRSLLTTSYFAKMDTLFT